MSHICGKHESHEYEISLRVTVIYTIPLTKKPSISHLQSIFIDVPLPLRIIKSVSVHWCPGITVKTGKTMRRSFLNRFNRFQESQSRARETENCRACAVILPLCCVVSYWSTSSMRIQVSRDPLFNSTGSKNEEER